MIDYKTHCRFWEQPTEPKCYACSMPGPHSCEFPGCGLPMCIKHRKRKAGGTLCPRHLGAHPVQDNAKPSLKYPDRGVATPAVKTPPAERGDPGE